MCVCVYVCVCVCVCLCVCVCVCERARKDHVSRVAVPVLIIRNGSQSRRSRERGSRRRSLGGRHWGSHACKSINSHDQTKPTNLRSRMVLDQLTARLRMRVRYESHILRKSLARAAASGYRPARLFRSRYRANMARIRQSRPASGPGSLVKALARCKLFPLRWEAVRLTTGSSPEAAARAHAAGSFHSIDFDRMLRAPPRPWWWSRSGAVIDLEHNQIWNTIKQ